MKNYKRLIFQKVKARAKEPRKFIQVLLGPRQVGKTTLALQIAKELKIASHYISADTATLENLAWLHAGWHTARDLTRKNESALLIIDEAQKIPHWADAVKQLWDEDTRNNIPLKVFMLGSSPWLIRKGIDESLAGRFEVIPITHWSFEEMRTCFQWNLDEYIYFGGYPGAANLANPTNPSRWINYINDSLIETTLSRDILLMTQVNKPALLRRLFQLGCVYSGKILSYQKMLGQLSDAGNTTTLSHYLELLAGAGLLTGIQKYANQTVRQRGSSPKFSVFNTALISAQSKLSFQEAHSNKVYWGHLLESCIGAHILNSIRGTEIEVFYWREANQEVDFVLQKGSKLIAIEVKSGKIKESLSGLTTFHKKFNPSRIILVGEQGTGIEEFLIRPIEYWF
jgi:hypothetical protein